MPMKLSVITVCYNNLVGLKATCESVQGQTFRDFEWLVIDGGSTDGTKEYLESLPVKPSYWCSELDHGIYNAMNKGIALAHGDYLLFLNSGDTLYGRQVVQQVVPLLDGADIVYGDAAFCKPKKSRLVQYPETFTLYHLWKGYTPCHQATFIKASLLKDHGGYDERYRIVADYRKWVEWKLAGKTYKHIAVTVCNYWLNGISTQQQTLHKQEHDAVIRELLSPVMQEQMEYVQWLKKGSRREQVAREGKTTVITPLYVVCWRMLHNWFLQHLSIKKE